jgi:hypothetical protein
MQQIPNEIDNTPLCPSSAPLAPAKILLRQNLPSPIARKPL